VARYGPARQLATRIRTSQTAVITDMSGLPATIWPWPPGLLASGRQRRHTTELRSAADRGRSRGTAMTMGAAAQPGYGPRSPTR